MTRIADLAFPHRAALFRGDGGGVAVIDRQEFDQGSAWARVVEPGAGITAAYLLLVRRSGGVAGGEIVAEDEVAAVAGDAEDLPRDGIAGDPRLTALGAFTEMADAAAARRADRATAEKTDAANAAIAAASFPVAGRFDGRRWRVRVGPTLASGTTTLECHGDDGELRLVKTSADRGALERARSEPVTVTGTYSERRLLGGMRTRSIEVELRPDEG
ncbi:hypothetical protein [Microbacterium sp. HJ5]